MSREIYIFTKDNTLVKRELIDLPPAANSNQVYLPIGFYGTENRVRAMGIPLKYPDETQEFSDISVAIYKK